MNVPVRNQPTAAEQRVIAAARARSERCACGEIHDDSVVSLATIGRARGYITAHPGHQLIIDEAGILAVIVLRVPGPPQVLATAGDLDELLDIVGAPGTESRS